jgi:PAS domain S-box-containing protein
MNVNEAGTWAKYVMDKSAGAVVWLNSTGQILYANQAADKLLNLPETKEKPLTVFDISEISEEEWLQKIVKLKKDNCTFLVLRVKSDIDGYRALVANINYYKQENDNLIVLTVPENFSVADTNLYTAAFENSNHFAAILNENGSVVSINTAGSQIIEKKDAQQPVWEIKPFNKSAKKQKKVQEYFLQAMAGKTNRFNIEFSDNKGDCRNYRFSFSPVKSNDSVFFVLATGFEITKLKSKQKMLIESESLYRTLAQNIPNMLYMRFDKNFRYTIVGGKALPKLHRSKKEIIGKTLFEISDEDDVERLLPYYKDALAGKTTSYEMQFHGNYFSVTFAPSYNDDNELDGGIVISYDINKIKAAEDQLNTKLSELEELNNKLTKEVHIRREIESNLKEYSEELKIKNLELEQFAYVASHDLQEPLRMISAFTQLLANKYSNNLDADTNEFIRYILDGATRMQRLINDLLIYSRVGRKNAEPETVQLSEIVENAKENLQIILEETDAQIILQNNVEINGDKGQLVQLLQNLISNAIKFRKKDGLPKIEISATDKDEFWEIAVKDNGIGFDMAHKERIFNIFQRLHSQGEYSGTGIGLAICKKIVERHGGEIWAVSEPGNGSTFYFTLKKNINISL